MVSVSADGRMLNETERETTLLPLHRFGGLAEVKQYCKFDIFDVAGCPTDEWKHQQRQQQQLPFAS